MKRASAIAGLWIMLLSSPAFGQGVLIVINPPHPVPLPRPIIQPRPVPPPPMSYQIKELAINARITDHVARVQVSQSFVNTGSQQMEVSFVFPLPYDGAIDRLTFMVDGKEYDAKLLPKDKARSVYETHIRRNQDPALLEWIDTGMFQTSVFPVPPGAERKVAIRFSQLLRKNNRLTDFLYPLSTAKYTSKPIERLAIDVTIECNATIKSVYSPTHQIAVKRSDSKQAVVSFESKNTVPATDFRLFYDVSEEKLGASVISFRPDESEDGYFLLMASPEIKSDTDQRPAKTAIFVVDRSGSMSGKKIDQAKEALRFVLNNLADGDLFNIVAYDNSVESFRPELQRCDQESRQAALRFVESMYAGGSTNIDGALATAMNMIQDSSRPNFIIFLTDGQPTAGETNESKIVVNAKRNNELNTRLISFGVGYDVNSRLLDRLSRDNFGSSEFVRPDENIEEHVSRLYNRISSPVLTNVVVEFDLENTNVEDGPAVTRVYPGRIHDLFAGEQMVLVGRYRKAGQAKVVVTGKVGDRTEKFDFPATLTGSSADQSYAFVEKIWAMRRIGEIIDELDLHGKNEELINELVALSTKHGILTPYTSFLADETSTVSELADVRGNVDRARRLLQNLDAAEGISGFAQRAEKKALREAIQVPLGGRAGFDIPPADGAGLAAGSGKSSPAVPPGAKGVTFRDIETDEEVFADSVQMVGNETLYKRGKLWIAANAKGVDLERDKQKIKVIQRFSEEYFKLIAANTPSENAVLARQQPGEELVITLRGQIYHIQ